MPLTQQKQTTPYYKRLEAINDQLFSIVRLLESAGSVPPPILDVVVIAMRKVHSDYQQLAYEQRSTEIMHERHDTQNEKPA